MAISNYEIRNLEVNEVNITPTMNVQVDGHTVNKVTIGNKAVWAKLSAMQIIPGGLVARHTIHGNTEVPIAGAGMHDIWTMNGKPSEESFYEYSGALYAFKHKRTTNTKIYFDVYTTTA